VLLEEKTSAGTSYVIVGVLIVVAILVQIGRRQSRSVELHRGERLRPLLITCIDPLISLLIIGPALWSLVSTHVANALGAIVGGAVGVVIGYFRARVMFVRAERATYSIVLKRSGLEYGFVLLLVVLRVVEGQLKVDHASAATVAVAALAGLALVEAFARSGFIVARFISHSDEVPEISQGNDAATKESNDGDSAPR
jgi:hypothetical protein